MDICMLLSAAMIGFGQPDFRSFWGRSTFGKAVFFCAFKKTPDFALTEYIRKSCFFCCAFKKTHFFSNSTSRRNTQSPNRFSKCPKNTDIKRERKFFLILAFFRVVWGSFLRRLLYQTNWDMFETFSTPLYRENRFFQCQIFQKIGRCWRF